MVEAYQDLADENIAITIDRGFRYIYQDLPKMLTDMPSPHPNALRDFHNFLFNTPFLQMLEMSSSCALTTWRWTESAWHQWFLDTAITPSHHYSTRRCSERSKKRVAGLALQATLQHLLFRPLATFTVSSEEMANGNLERRFAHIVYRHQARLNREQATLQWILARINDGPVSPLWSLPAFYVIALLYSVSSVGTYAEETMPERDHQGGIEFHLHAVSLACNALGIAQDAFREERALAAQLVLSVGRLGSWHAIERDAALLFEEAAVLCDNPHTYSSTTLLRNIGAGWKQQYSSTLHLDANAREATAVPFETPLSNIVARMQPCREKAELQKAIGHLMLTKDVTWSLAILSRQLHCKNANIRRRLIHAASEIVAAPRALPAAPQPFEDTNFFMHEYEELFLLHTFMRPVNTMIGRRILHRVQIARRVTSSLVFMFPYILSDPIGETFSESIFRYFFKIYRYPPVDAPPLPWTNSTRNSDSIERT